MAKNPSTTSREWQPAITSLFECELPTAGATTLSFSKDMKAIPVIGTLSIIAAQMIAFLGLWTAMVAVARSYGRFPPELFFGITIYYGFMFIVGIFIISGLVAYLSTKPFVRWGTIFAGLVGWLFWLWPSFDSRPFAMPAFFALGTLLLIVGTGFGVPGIRRYWDRRAAQESKMENKPAHTTAGNAPV
jgi:hypothetical protein